MFIKSETTRAEKPIDGFVGITPLRSFRIFGDVGPEELMLLEANVDSSSFNAVNYQNDISGKIDRFEFKFQVNFTCPSRRVFVYVKTTNKRLVMVRIVSVRSSVLYLTKLSIDHIVNDLANGKYNLTQMQDVINDELSSQMNTGFIVDVVKYIEKVSAAGLVETYDGDYVRKRFKVKH